MFIVKAIKEDGSRDVFALSRYSVRENPASYEVSGDEPGRAEGLSLYVRDDGYHHIIVENAAGRNVEHLKLGALLQHKMRPPAPPRKIGITVNGEKMTIVPDGLCYRSLVELAKMQGNPSVTVRFGDRSREGIILYPGMPVELDDGAAVNVDHTGNA